MLKNLTNWNLAHLWQRIHRNCGPVLVYRYTGADTKNETIRYNRKLMKQWLLNKETTMAIPSFTRTPGQTRNCRQLQTFFFFVPGIPGFVQRHDEEQTCNISKKWNTIGDKLAPDVQLTNVDQIPGSGEFISKTEQCLCPARPKKMSKMHHSPHAPVVSPGCPLRTVTIIVNLLVQ